MQQALCDCSLVQEKRAYCDKGAVPLWIRIFEELESIKQ